MVRSQGGADSTLQAPDTAANLTGVPAQCIKTERLACEVANQRGLRDRPNNPRE